MAVVSAPRYSPESSGTTFASQPSRVRAQSSPGRLTASSVTSARLRNGASGRRSCERAVSRLGLPFGAGDALEAIYAPEVEVASDEDPEPLALVLHQGRRDVDGRVERPRDHLLP